jgi:nucleoid DNA-binding protein
MTNTDIVNKIALEHNLTSGRAEMIINIIVERITERLVSDGSVKVNNFGEFKIVKNSLSEMIISDSMLNKKRVIFEPGKEFLDAINNT